MIAGYTIVLCIALLYSFTLLDPNITLINHPLWNSFREPMVQLGYHNRPLSWIIYLTIIILLFGFHYFFVKKYKQFNVVWLSVAIGFILLLSYPLLSHDLFNYMFDARVLTFYGENPYAKMALDFPQDEWLRFMHWTHRAYPYGPSFLIVTLIPSFLSFGKLILNYILFKGLFILAYIVTVIYLNKINKKSAVEFATHPFILVEGLINAHNDLLGVTFAIIGAYYLLESKQVWGRIGMILSAGIKYISAPLVFMKSKKNVKWNALILLGQVVLLAYLIMTKGFQQWYLLIAFAYVPFFPEIIKYINIFLMGLLVSYYPYIRLGGWDSTEKVLLKETIIYTALAINVVIILLLLIYKKYLHHDKKTKALI